ncbi:hypothetical protein IFM89_021644 [Coptis chinensis]|uniref:MORF/ORRM1/DAG-like MORF domain-containing protein n=1 Tax=Coptis chinensis TaxID=261450 RepID=A0A835IG16_9MAGN|nr:hypothetical protein IFM89_021644 [Coptis chinensis]
MFRHLIKHSLGIFSPSIIPPFPSSFSSFVKGCDYQHWLVVMNRPLGYPLRDEIIEGYIKTLSLAMGGALPNVRWVLPDSHIDAVENDYGGEPFVNGKAVPYEEKYHADWNQGRSRNGKI